MNRNLWATVDRYLENMLIPEDPILEAALKSNASAGLPPYGVTATQGKLLYLLAKIQGAKRILEIGTLGGYSTIWLARALPGDGKIISLESDAEHARVAAANIERAGLKRITEILVAPALKSLQELERRDTASFDLIFIDADKPNNPEYLKWALRFSRQGTIIVGDNVVREGSVIEQDNTDTRVRGTRRFLEMIGGEPRLTATAIQTVGSKGYDGFVVAVVTG